MGLTMYYVKAVNKKSPDIFWIFLTTDRGEFTWRLIKESKIPLYWYDDFFKFKDEDEATCFICEYYWQIGRDEPDKYMDVTATVHEIPEME